MTFILKYVLARLGEPSTWKAILSIATGAGLALTGAQVDAIAAAMVSVYAALSLIFPDVFGGGPPKQG